MPMLQGSIMSELYQLPDGWEWKKLSDIGKISTGKTPSKSNKEFYENGMIRFVKPPNLQNSIEIKKTEADEFITENEGIKGMRRKVEEIKGYFYVSTVPEFSVNVSIKNNC